MAADGKPEEDVWLPRGSTGAYPLTDEEIRAVRYAAPFVNGIRGAGVVLKVVAVIVKWGGCIILIGLALKSGAPLSQLINIWPHG